MEPGQFAARYSAEAWDRTAVNSLPGVTLLEFGTAWCGFCQAAQPLIRTVVDQHADVRHLKVEDGKGRPLGRSFRVTLWPTLIVLRDGVEIGRVVRPDDAAELDTVVSRAVEPRASGPG